ncbi:beta-glucuronidase [Vibrio harveyi]|uniref:beta-glucuronidase n=1 Tax=Vibrio harveyi TaxID=669 RepID=UPI003CF900A3
MLYPQANETRNVIDISGIWKFKFDRDGVGRKQNWKDGLTDTLEMAVPSSYNDIFTQKELRDHCGDVWYQTEFYVPKEWDTLDSFIRFGSATHRAVVWVNGVEVATHEGGYMPFLGKLNDIVNFGEKNTVVVVVNNELSKATIPCGSVKSHIDGTKEVKPAFDFFNYSGLHRPVKLIAGPRIRVSDISVVTDFEGDTGYVDYSIKVRMSSPIGISFKVSLFDHSGATVSSSEDLSGTLDVDNVNLWEPGEGYLYELEVKVLKDDKLVDVYRLPVGIRTVEVIENKFFINKKPFYFKGFGKHEDSITRGRGYDPVVNLRDFELLDWVGANSIRTSHYPYSEEFMQLADQKGLVVIDECPAVGQWNVGDLSSTMGNLNGATDVHFDLDIVKTEGMTNHKHAISELIERDKNHPCVVMWSLSNEPDTVAKSSDPYFKEIFDFARPLDPQGRPLTLVLSMLSNHANCNASKHADVLCINRYTGWYMNNGLEMRTAHMLVASDLEAWEVEDKPIIITEYGADTVSGLHKLPSTMFTEEYYVEFLDQQHKAFDGCSSVVGEHVWNFADFQTWEGIIRVDGNKKGVFTRERQPKMAAHHLRNRWQQIPDYEYKE